MLGKGKEKEKKGKREGCWILSTNRAFKLN